MGREYGNSAGIEKEWQEAYGLRTSQQVKQPELHLLSEFSDQFSFSAHANAANYFNGKLHLHNKEHQWRFSNLTVRLSSNPEFFATKTWHVPTLTPQSSMSFSCDDLEYNDSWLLSLSTSVNATLTYSLSLQTEMGEKILSKESRTITVLAPQEWGGANSAAELLPMFVVPHDSTVTRITRDALRSIPGGITPGYGDRKPEQVRDIVDALYSALNNLSLSFDNRECDFWLGPHPIKTPQQMLRGQKSTSLDLAILMASIFEQVGLHPVLLLYRKMALVGVWLRPTLILDALTMSRAEIIRYQRRQHNLLILDARCLAHHPNVNFQQAQQSGNLIIDEANDGSFIGAFDIRLSRIYGISYLKGVNSAFGATKLDVLAMGAGQTPISTSSSSSLNRLLPSIAGIIAGDSLDGDVNAVPKHSADIGSESVKVAPKFTSATERLNYNKSRLLNLTPANPLLNTQADIRAIDSLLAWPDQLLSYLSAGKSLNPLPLSIWEKTPEGADHPIPNQPFDREPAEIALNNGHLFIDLPEDELSRRLNRFYHSEQNERQQQGVGTMSLACLFMSWRQPPNTYQAPVFLLPLTLRAPGNDGGWQLQAVSSELWLNENLMEFLHRVYGMDSDHILPTLKDCAARHDLMQASQLLNQAAKIMPGVNMVPEVALCHCPLSRFQVWYGLEHLQLNERNKNLVQALLAPNEQEIALDNIPAAPYDGIALEDQYPAESLLLPWACDASQIEAITQSLSGQNMALLAPPGTGKNRTLTNLLAVHMSQGRKVLLISKNRTTLRNVKHMLDLVGLGAFCLYLRSPRAPGLDVLQHLKQAWQTIPQQLNNAGERLREASSYHYYLQQLYRSLHKRHSNGLCVYEVLSEEMERAANPSPLNLAWSYNININEQELASITKLIDSLARHLSDFNDADTRVLRHLRHNEWSSEWDQQLCDELQLVSALNDELEQALATFWKALECDVDFHKASTRAVTWELAELLINCGGRQLSFALANDAAQKLDILVRMAVHTDAFAAAAAELSCPYEPTAWRRLAGKKLGERWEDALKSIWPLNTMKKKKLLQEAADGGALGEPDLAKDGPLLDRMCSEGTELEELACQLNMPGLWHGFDTTSAELLELEDLGKKLRSFIGSLQDPELIVLLKPQLQTLLYEHRELFAPGGTIGASAINCLHINQQLQEHCQTLFDLAGIDLQPILQESQDVSTELRSLLHAIIELRPRWRTWCRWCDECLRAESLNLTPVIEALTSGQLNAETATAQFQSAYKTWWLNETIAHDETLANFNATDTAQIMDFYQASGTDFRKLVGQAIAQRVVASIPRPEAVPPQSPWAMLRDELSNAKNSKTATELWRDMPEVITTLSPCVLMSPAAAAHFLSQNSTVFDLVICAEASQLTVEESIVPCSRCSQIITVGDPQQMPPLFDSCSGIEESILDRLLKCGVLTRRLRQQYHAQDESLIAYANHRYYGNSLYTFPAPVYATKAIKLAHIDGPFDRAKKTNLQEAQAVVNEIVYRLSRSSPHGHPQTLGVITLSLNQQQLIEDLLIQARVNHPQIEWAFSEESCAAPVIVRYLESAQSEVRDVIFLCLTYGKDEDGQISMDFGPLNKIYGSNLLNVAMTRARQELLVCANFNSEALDLGRTQTSALRDVKEFLAYVEDNYRIELGEAPQQAKPDPLIERVAQGLESKGWTVDFNVGLSPLRVDLAVVHPDGVQNYLAGIFSDGSIYRDNPITSDRDFIRPAQYKWLGWNLLRIWSLEWWQDEEGALDRLHQNLVRLLRNERAKPRR